MKHHFHIFSKQGGCIISLCFPLKNSDWVPEGIKKYIYTHNLHTFNIHSYLCHVKYNVEKAQKSDSIFIKHVVCVCISRLFLLLLYEQTYVRRVNNTYDGIMYRGEIVSFWQQQKLGACCTAYYQLCTSSWCLKLSWFLILHFNINRKRWPIMWKSVVEEGRRNAFICGNW